MYNIKGGKEQNNSYLILYNWIGLKKNCNFIMQVNLGIQK